MKKVFGILAIFFIVYLLDQFAIGNSTFISLLYILTWVYAGYLIIRYVAGNKKAVQNIRVNPSVGKSDTLNPAPGKEKTYTGALVIILIVLAMICIRYLGIISINFILFMNRLLQVSTPASAVTFWAIAGLFVGMIYGAFVAWKKYRLHITVNIFPIAALAIFVGVMFFLNDPMKPSARLVSTLEDASRFVSVRSSGYLPSYNLTSFADSNIIDGDNNTTWIENARNAGVGEWLEFKFNTITHINEYKSFLCTGFHIKNGYAKSKKLWEAHNRLREFKVLHNGNIIGNFTAGNYFNQEEVINIEPFAVKFNDVVTVQISSVYYGNRNFKLTAITEMVPIVKYTQ